jgi:hypothetical protein
MSERSREIGEILSHVQAARIEPRAIRFDSRFPLAGETPHRARDVPRTRKRGMNERATLSHGAQLYKTHHGPIRVALARGLSASRLDTAGRPCRISRELRDYSGRKFIFISPRQLVAAARSAGVAGLQVFRVDIRDASIFAIQASSYLPEAETNELVDRCSSRKRIVRARRSSPKCRVVSSCILDARDRGIVQLPAEVS